MKRPAAKRARLEDGAAVQNARHLRSCCDQSVQDAEALAEEATAAEARKPSSIIKLNVGGQNYITDAADIHRHEGSMLASMFSGRMQPGLLVDGGVVFIKCDGTLFRHILNFIWEGRTWQVPDDVDKRALKREAEYCNLPEIVDSLAQSIIGTPTLSLVSSYNLRVVPGSGTLLLKNPLFSGGATYAASNLRSFTATVQVHFPETMISFGIRDHPKAENRKATCWGISRNKEYLTTTHHYSKGWRSFGNHPVAMRELRLCFASGPEPRLAYCIDGG